ncbi:MAG TPA: HEAT repeat domain-containing protein [Kofleriaceae bacterium]|nr:HEAT repeat domain-containing protein [Kofleriaceae bacterium]
MNNIRIKLAAVAVLALAPSAAFAGKGGSAAAIDAAVHSGSTDAIIAEIERAESLLCPDCIQTLTNLTEDSRYEVREVAAWWFARRPALKDMLASQFVGDLPHGDTIKVRNAADFLGRTKTYTALPQLRAAIHRADLGAEAKLALVRAAGFMAHTGGNEVLTTAMVDTDAGVRAAAVAAWPRVIGQSSAQPVVALLGDGDAGVRAMAAGVVGDMNEQSARGALEALVLHDPDSAVRRNAAWALGRLGNAASSAALIQATTDRSGLVRGVAKAALAQLH